MDEWAGPNLHIIFVAVEMEAAAGDGSGGLVASVSVHFMVRGGEKLPRNWELRPNMAPGRQAGASPLPADPGGGRGRHRLLHFNAVNKILTVGSVTFGAHGHVHNRLVLFSVSLPISVLGNIIL